MSQTGGPYVPVFPGSSSTQPLVPERGGVSVPDQTLGPLMSSVIAQEQMMSGSELSPQISLGLRDQWDMLSRIPTEVPEQLGLGGIKIEANNQQGTLFSASERQRQREIHDAQNVLRQMSGSRNVDQSLSQIQREIAQNDHKSSLVAPTVSAEGKADKVHEQKELSEIMDLRRELRKIASKNHTNPQADAAPTAESNNHKPDKSWLSLLRRALLSQFILKRRQQANTAQLAAARAKKKQMRGMFLEAQVKRADMTSMIENIDPMERDSGES